MSIEQQRCAQLERGLVRIVHGESCNSLSVLVVNFQQDSFSFWREQIPYKAVKGEMMDEPPLHPPTTAHLKILGTDKHQHHSSQTRKAAVFIVHSCLLHFWTKMHVAIYIICQFLLDKVRYSKENALNHLDMVVYCQPSRFKESVIFDTSWDLL